MQTTFIALIGSFLIKYFPFAYALFTAFRLMNNLIIKRGHFRSAISWSSVDKNGSPIPWFTYPAIDYLNTLNLDGKHIFEYGSGNSTHYFELKGALIESIENDQSWYEKVSKRTLKEGTKIHFQSDPTLYANQIAESYKKFDIIIVDGVHRDKCAEVAIKYLADDGFIILDNDQDYLEATKVLDQTNLFKVVFRGFTAITPYEGSTAFYFNKK